MYSKVSTGLGFADREQQILDFWKNKDIFKKSIENRKDAPIFTFYEGPPTANGQPHIGHVITRAVKDLIPRYKTMKGYRVPRKAGWDTHGLPVELEVEKQLGISGKPEIEIYGIEPFIKKCKESVFKYESIWRDMSERVGYWMDFDHPYVTYSNDYIESVWWALSEIWKQDLVYKSYRVVPYCPRCGTPLSSHEVAQGYKEVKDTSAYVNFKVAEKDNEYLLAWTTTPWTLPSNVGLCVNAKYDYVKVKQNEKIYILAKDLVAPVMGDDVEIIASFKGSDLEGLKYEPIFNFVPQEADNYCTVVCDGYVTLSDGTGIVHIAPAFGEDDSRISKAYNLPFIQLVNAEGNFTDEADFIKGLFVKDADPEILKDLKIRGQLYKKAPYVHNYPFCWRCDTPLLYYARDAWFIRVSSLRDKLLQSNDTVNWMPEHMKEGRFGNFLENVIDWSISRERYWGTPLPIWECTHCGDRHMIGSIAELKERSDNCPDDIELHRPYIDAVTITCTKCHAVMNRTPEVIDCWFDSGSMPFAQWHFPFENQETFKEQFPAAFISEAVDQTRGWFYSLMSISTMLFNTSPYQNVIVLGHGLDEKGQKMSKSKGNAVSPMDALNKHGADAVRWFLYSNSAPWINFRYSDEAVNEGVRRFMGTLWNTYAFYVLYADIDQFNPYEHQVHEPSILDQWLLSRLNTLTKNVDAALSRFEVVEPARMLDGFVDDLSNWYLRRSRERFWVSGMPQDKINAFKTLHYAIVTVTKLAAPFVPFMSENIYQNMVVSLDLNAPESVHLCDYPISDVRFINKELEQQMSQIMDIVVLGRSARNTSNVKNRQPLSNMLVCMPPGAATPSASFVDVIAEELNVKSVQFIEDASEYSSILFKPQLRTLGPKYGKLIPKITAALNENPTGALKALKAGNFEQDIDGVNVVLTMDDVLIETLQKDGFAAASDFGITVVLDTVLTDALILEGHKNEIISKLQSMRKEADYNITDRIHIGYSDNTVLNHVFQVLGTDIETEVLADTCKMSEPPANSYAKQWNINGNDIILWVEKA